MMHLLATIRGTDIRCIIPDVGAVWIHLAIVVTVQELEELIMAIASMFLMFPAEAVSVILRNDERLLGRRNPNLAPEKFGAKGTKGKQYFFLNI